MGPLVPNGHMDIAANGAQVMTMDNRVYSPIFSKFRHWKVTFAHNSGTLTQPLKLASPFMGKKGINKVSFFCPPQELEVGPRRGQYLLVCLIGCNVATLQRWLIVFN